MIQRELAKVISAEITDPRIGMVTITNVDLSKDLRHAKVFVTQIGSTFKNSELIEYLTSTVGYLKHTLAKRVNLRFTPNIIFEFDESIERALRLTELINSKRKTNNNS